MSVPAGPEIRELIDLLAKMPGLGPRSARKAVLHLIAKRDSLMRPLAKAMATTADAIVVCEDCGNLDTTSPCRICRDEERDKSVICVIEDAGDLWAMERAAVHKGRYHVLGGVLSALDGVGPDDLNIASLIARAQADAVEEVILGLSATVDGQTTAHYLTDVLADAGVRVTRLAHGVPVGGELDYLDEGTLAAAMNARRPL